MLNYILEHKKSPALARLFLWVNLIMQQTKNLYNNVEVFVIATGFKPVTG
jgi:hypothetical protein